LTFNTTGQITSAPLAVSITPAQLGYAGAVAPMAFNLSFAGSTQFGSPFAVNTLLQDGYAAGLVGRVQNWFDGTVLGNYTNGQTQVIGQAMYWLLSAIRKGLQPLGNGVWAQTPDSWYICLSVRLAPLVSLAFSNPRAWKMPTLI
jgi:flagellar hook protein FlgE